MPRAGLDVRQQVGPDNMMKAASDRVDGKALSRPYI